MNIINDFQNIFVIQDFIIFSFLKQKGKLINKCLTLLINIKYESTNIIIKNKLYNKSVPRIF